MSSNLFKMKRDNLKFPSLVHLNYKIVHNVLKASRWRRAPSPHLLCFSQKMHLLICDKWPYDTWLAEGVGVNMCSKSKVSFSLSFFMYNKEWNRLIINFHIPKHLPFILCTICIWCCTVDLCSKSFVLFQNLLWHDSHIFISVQRIRIWNIVPISWLGCPFLGCVKIHVVFPCECCHHNVRAATSLCLTASCLTELTRILSNWEFIIDLVYLLIIRPPWFQISESFTVVFAIPSFVLE